MVGEYYFHEMMGAGAALFDYDLDGDLDVYLVQGHPLGRPGEGAPPADPRYTDRLYRNDLALTAAGERRLSFTDVTAESGIVATGYGMGVAVGDYDGDGRPDLYLTNFGDNQLWRNVGDGTFREVGATAGVADERWSVPALFADFDGDGDQDLFVGNYVEFSVDTNKRCTTDLGEPNYCGPLAYTPLEDVLYENLGNGRFREATGRAGLTAAPPGGTLGAVSGDFDGDGDLDLYVANDGLPNHLWINLGGGLRFEEQALLAGTAVNLDGDPEASMGLAAADLDGDGDEDLFLTHLTGESNTLYLNQGDGMFDDRSTAAELAVASWESTGFGTAALDYDNDGLLDLLAVNGAVRIIPALARAGDPFPLHQTNQLFRNLGGGRFEEVSAAMGAAFRSSEVGRGAAVGDLDNDGDSDLLIGNNNGPVRLLINRAGDAGGWLGLRLIGGSGGDALGAWVGLGPPADTPPAAVSGGRTWRRVRTDGSYASAGDPRVLFGLGPESAEGRRYSALVRWPGGDWERFGDLEPGRYTTLTAGSGEPAAAPGGAP